MDGDMLLNLRFIIMCKGVRRLTDVILTGDRLEPNKQKSIIQRDC